jgi:hypothetical protein
MYALLTQLRSRTAVATEAVCFSAAMITAEFFFKFHSFSLECVAFLALWFCLGAVGSAVVGRPEEAPAV